MTNKDIMDKIIKEMYRKSGGFVHPRIEEIIRESVQAFFDYAVAALSNGEKVVITNFGVFKKSERAEKRLSANTVIPATVTINFRPSDMLKQIMNLTNKRKNKGACMTNGKNPL
jgi:nucleoid DNA-binding protein